jgi:outer membrane protein OmpA-like peptidoglycan-associated protein
VYDIADGYFMPVVRNVPVFPDKDLSVGDTWTAPGEERHDFRKPYGIEKPYKIPFVAGYEYLGDRTFKGKAYPAFKVSYTLFYQPPVPETYTLSYPTQIMGYSNQVVYWGRDIGQPYAYEESFKIVIDFADGYTYEFNGTATAEVLESRVMDRKKTAQDVERAIKSLGIDSASVRQDDKGVTITLDNINFRADSSLLQDSEKDKLKKIAQILGAYKDRDVLVTGHTALAGTAEAQDKLSQERAQAVADYLIKLGARSAERVTVRGMGARVPVADNSSEEGMKKNRRVEITILEN